MFQMYVISSCHRLLLHKRELFKVCARLFLSEETEESADIIPQP